MKYYIEITLIPSVDVESHFLWSKFYQQVHLALVEMQNNHHAVEIGVAFPEYDVEKHQLGSKLRFFAKEQTLLLQLNIKNWLKRLLDYVHITQIREVPEQVNAYAIYKRKQPTRSFSKLKRTIKRKALREGVSMEEAMEDLEKHLAKTEDKSVYIEKMSSMKPPFIKMRSLSSDKQFCLYITKEQVDLPVDGSFTVYGLSNKTTVPEF